MANGEKRSHTRAWKNCMAPFELFAHRFPGLVLVAC
jgi:hypothetical protein